jgi:hypothetical protein
MRSSSFEEQPLIQPPEYPVTRSGLENFEAFHDQVSRGRLRPGDLMILSNPMVLGMRTIMPLAAGLEYEVLVSMSFHSRWVQNGLLAPCMRQFVDLFVGEWNYLRRDLVEWGGSLSRELLFRDHPDAGYDATKWLGRLWQISTLGIEPATVPAVPDKAVTGEGQPVMLSPLESAPGVGSRSGQSRDRVPDDAAGQTRPALSRTKAFRRLVPKLKVFCQLGDECRRRGTFTYNAVELSQALGLPDWVIRRSVNELDQHFREHFRDFGYPGVTPAGVISDEDSVAPEGAGLRVIDRKKGRNRTTICDPLGLAALELAEEFLRWLGEPIPGRSVPG